jgi:hypothetical protein
VLLNRHLLFYALNDLHASILRLLAYS